MASKPHQSLGDVSCRATGYTIQQLQRMGLPTAHLTRGLVHTLDDLQSHSALIPWDDYLVFLRNSHTDLPTDQLVELCTSYKGSPHLRPLLSAAGLWFHPARCFQWVADPESGAIRQLFRCVKTRFTRVDESEVVIEEVVAPGLALPPDIFWETQSIAFGALTTHFGLGLSIVTWEPIERGAAFRIRLPRRRPIRFVLSWLASWFRRDTAEDIRSILSFGHERSLRLEREIAERKTAEAAHRESEERFRRITDAVPGIVYQYYLDPDGRQGFGFVSAGAAGLSGYSTDELLARPELIWERMDPADSPAVRQSILESARTGAPWQHEFRFRTKTGATRWGRTHSVPEAATATGRVVWNGIMTDVTAERQADAALHARDALLQKLSEQVPGFIYQYQQWPDGRSCFPYASEGIRDVYEVAPEDVRASAEMVFGRLHPEDFDTVAQSIRRSLESLEPWRCEYRVRLPGRGTRWLDGHAVPERMPDGSTIWHGYIRDVTDRKQAEETIRESENRFRTLIEDFDVGVVLQDETDHVLVSNAAAAATLGLTRDQLHGVTSMDPGWELVREDGTPYPPDQVPSVEAARSRLPVRNAVLGTRHRQTGHRTWLQVNATPGLNADGSLRHVLVSLVDITERKRAEEALRASEARFRAFMKLSPIFAWIVTADGRFLFANHGFAALVKKTPDAVERSTIHDVFAPEYIAEYIANNRKVLEAAAPIETIAHFPRPDGTEGEFLAYKFLVPTSDGSPQIGGIAVDITERRRAEEALAESRDAAERALADVRVASARAEQFYRLCEVAGQGIGIARLDGALAYMNPAFRRILEIPEGDDITLRAFWELVPSENHQFLADTILTHTRETGSWSGELDLLTLTGKRVPIINTVVLLRDPDGTVVGYSNIATDISEQKRAEAALRESEERFRAYIDNAPTGLVVLDENGRYIDVNPTSCRMSGYDREELLRMGVGDLTTPEAKSESRPTFDRINQDGAIEVDWLLRRKSGELRQISIAAVRLSGNRSMGYITDITERKRAESELRESEERLRLALSAATAVAFVWDTLTDSVVRYFSTEPALPANPHAPEPVAAVVARVYPDDRARFEAGIGACLADGSDYRNLYRVVRPDGTVRWLEEWGTLGLDRDGRPARLTGISIDVTARREDEAAFQLAEHRQRLALDAGRMGTWDWEIGSDRLTWDEREQRLYGFSPGEFDGRLDSFLDRVHPDDRAGVNQVLANAAAGKDFDGEFRIRLASGEIRWVHGSGAVVPRSDQSPPRLVGINYDVTERKRAEETVRQILDGIAPRTGREFFRVLVDYLCEVCEVQFAFAGSIDPNNLNLVRTIAVSHRGQVADNFTYDLRGTPCEKVVGHTFCSFPTGVQQSFPDDTMLVDMGIEGYLGTPLWSNRGQPLGLIVLLHDRPIPYPEQAGVVLKVVAARAGAELERQQADAALRESEERLRIFVENAPAGVAMLDQDLRYISYSQRWLTDYGLHDQTLIGRTHYEVFPDVTDRWKEIHSRCLRGASERCEQDRFERADGTVDYLRWEIQPWRDSTGAVGGLVFFTEMITDRVRAEEQVRASLREKEAMLKEIHHRVKNNLQVISSLLSLQAARVTHPAATDVLAESQNRVRAMALVHETLYRSEDFARVDLARYLGELSGYLFRSYGVDSARIRLVMEVEPVSVSLDKTIPCGLLVNEIVSNSLKYAFPGSRSGTVTIRARTQPDGNLYLTLADDGVGLPADVVVDRTPSLGLQLVNILTEQLGGQLTVERSQGTQFSITFSPSQSHGA